MFLCFSGSEKPKNLKAHVLCFLGLLEVFSFFQVPKTIKQTFAENLLGGNVVGFSRTSNKPKKSLENMFSKLSAPHQKKGELIKLVSQLLF